MLFNANRETSDHGPINTWDRQPYLTEENGQGPSLVPKLNLIHNNFLIVDYGSLYAVDHDDGSAYYLDSYNFNVYSGTKNYLGHSKVNDHQLFVYADAIESDGRLHCQDDLSEPYDENWQNNKCILLSHTTPYLFNYCDETKLKAISPHLNNAFYTSTGQLNFTCGSKSYTLEEWQKASGQEQGSTVARLPTVNTIISWGQQVMYLKNGKSVTEEPVGW